MKFKPTAVSVALLIASGVSAQNLPYYSIETLDVNADGANYGPFPTAISDDATVIITHSMKASLSSNVDIGLPYTFNRECQYNDTICKLEYYGSETAGDLSYLNAYQAWRDAQFAADTSGYESYMMANVLTSCSVVTVPYSTKGTELNCSDNAQTPYDAGYDDTDVKITGFYKGATDNFIIGYSSDSYEGGTTRDFVRRAFIKNLSDGTVIDLNPDFITDGGFSSAYAIKEMTNGDVFVVGNSSVSSIAYFDECYLDDSDDRYSLGELTHCPGFHTQAVMWDVTSIVDGTGSTATPTGEELATEWIRDESSTSGDTTFSAHAADINTSGIAVGASSFEESDNSEGARSRAIIMTPDSSDNYGVPTELTLATDDISDEDETIYNTWAVTVSDNGIITGNREYDGSKSSNKPTEFFVYDNDNASIKFPLLNKKIATTEERIDNSGSYYISKEGANSRVYDANESDMMVGEIDDYDQTGPVNNGAPRSQTAFLFDSTNDQAWRMNDLICSQDATTSVVSSPYIRIITARVINDNGVVLADGYVYPTAEDYKNKNNGVQTAFKLTPNGAVSSPNDSPNCWESELLKSTDETYSRSGGGATFWLWLFALPVVFIRRFKR